MKHNYCALISIELEKVFDTLDHSIILAKKLIMEIEV